MKSGQQIADFGQAVEAKMAETRRLLPEDLVVNRVSDQPLQVAENVDLFMSSLYEAIARVEGAPPAGQARPGGQERRAPPPLGGGLSVTAQGAGGDPRVLSRERKTTLSALLSVAQRSSS